MRAMRIVLLIANGVWLPLFAYQGASCVHYFATFPTTHVLIFVSVLLANAIPSSLGSLTLAGNIAYIWRSLPLTTCRIVLLIANGVWLPIYSVGAPSSVYVLATRTHDYPVAEAIATHVVCFFILVGNVAYIWRSRRHTHNEKGASAPHARGQSITSAQP